MKRKAGMLCIILGTVLILAALSLLLFNHLEATQAKDSAEEVVSQLETAVPTPSETQDDTEMTVKEIDGYDYIGYLSIPVLGLELPVMNEWDYARLRISPCRYSGSTKTNHLVICAHNYDSHFGRLKTLSPGDEILFTDMDGVTWQYEVVLVDVLSPTDVEAMTDETYNLTLFTCTYGGQSRITVHCKQVAWE